MKLSFLKTFFLFFLFTSNAFADSVNKENDYGTQFSCSNKQEVVQLSTDLLNELKLFNLDKQIKLEINGYNVLFYLPTNFIKSNETTQIKNDFHLKNDKIYLPTLKKYVNISSKKEILLALSYPGRLTKITSCNISTLKEHIGIRQNIVLWSSILNWQWPNGGSASWNKKIWDYGTPNNLNKTYEALYDSFLNPKKYGIGCYTATKMVYAFSILDYYKRVNPNKINFNKVLQLLIVDNDPLVAVEPGIMWNFEDSYDFSKDNYDGKLLNIDNSVSKNSFIPGDWIYILNTDKETYKKTGYEGSNAIYLGNNKFDDYYNDNNHFYTFEEKLDEVYQWRNKVFSKSRDFKNLEYLTKEKINSLKNNPENNGLLMNTRMFPKFFN